jgi:Uma2 family endonuclease
MIVSAQSTSGQRFLASTDWDGYLGVLEAFKNRRIKITYDRGALELVSPSAKHERIKTLLARIIEFSSIERQVDAVGAGSRTFRRKVLEKGLEPDECYYVNRGPLPDVDDEESSDEEYPVPDLALEIEVSCSALDRLGIYRAMGIAEVWRYTAQHQLIVLSLGPQGYEEVQESRFLPFLPPGKVAQLVKFGLKVTSLELIKELRAWLAETNESF